MRVFTTFLGAFMIGLVASCAAGQPESTDDPRVVQCITALAFLAANHEHFVGVNDVREGFSTFGETDRPALPVREGRARLRTLSTDRTAEVINNNCTGLIDAELLESFNVR